MDGWSSMRNRVWSVNSHVGESHGTKALLSPSPPLPAATPMSFTREHPIKAAPARSVKDIERHASRSVTQKIPFARIAEQLVYHRAARLLRGWARGVGWGGEGEEDQPLAQCRIETLNASPWRILSGPRSRRIAFARGLIRARASSIFERRERETLGSSTRWSSLP